MKAKEIIKNRENIEWLNYWVEDANIQKKRILLIGDSVIRSFRKMLNKVVQTEGYVVDLIATSANPLDKGLQHALKTFFKINANAYSTIIWGIGAHHGYWVDCNGNDVQAKRYKQAVEIILKELTKYTEQMVLLAAPPEQESEETKSIINKHNLEILKRNELLKSISEKYGYQYIDLYTFFKEGDVQYSDYRHIDDISNWKMAWFVVEALLHIDKEINIHMINHIKDMIECIEQKVKHGNKNIYIYGNKKHGNLIKKYVSSLGYYVSGFIVSDEFYQKNVDTISVMEIDIENSYVIVTPEDYCLWKKLEEMKVDYVYLNERIYEVLDEWIRLGDK